MNISSKHLNAIILSSMLCLVPDISAAQDTQKSPALPPASDMDLSIKYFNRELSTDGVLHESSYEESMLRRNGHVWTQRVLPKQISENDTTHPPLPNPPPSGEGTNESLRDIHVNHEHKDFNYIVLPRHVAFDGSKTTVEFIDMHERQVIYIAPTEYENVNFDGSWLNTYYLVNPQYVAAMPLASRPSTTAHTQWHEAKNTKLYQRILWNDKLNIPLIIETGDIAGTFLNRITVSPKTKLTQNIPWQRLQGFTQKEYSDFLD